MNKLLSIILIFIIITILALYILCNQFIRTNEKFTNTIQSYRNKGNIDFNYNDFSSERLITDISQKSSIEFLLANFCFKTDFNGQTEENWDPNNNNILQIIKDNIPIRTSEVHILDNKKNLDSKYIQELLKEEITNLKRLGLGSLFTHISNINNDINDNPIKTDVIVGPVYVIFIQNPYHIEHNTKKNSYNLKDIYFNKKNDNGFTPPYAKYNDGIFDTNIPYDKNKEIDTQLLFLFPMYHKTYPRFYAYDIIEKCTYYTFKEINFNVLKPKESKKNVRHIPNFKGITDMVRFFNSNNYINLSTSNSIKFEISKDTNCFIRCKNSLRASDSDIQLSCGCASRIFKKPSVVTSDIPSLYNTKCKSSEFSEIENSKFYTYGFVYRVNEIVIPALYNFIIKGTDLTKLEKSFKDQLLNNNCNKN